jgi:hypothetical protein
MAGENCDNCVKPLCDERRSVCNARFEQLEKNQGELYTLARDSVAAQARADGKVDVLLTKVDSMDKNLFAFLQQQGKSQDKERQAEIDAELKKAKIDSQERSQAQKTWIDYGKYIIAMTIAALITYILTTGGA